MKPQHKSAPTRPLEQALFEDDAQSERPQLIVDIDGFEGPLDLLLELARKQQIDLAAISVIKLVEQYLDFIGEVQRSNLIIAADYLVTAAWLTYLKSRLLVPNNPEDDQPDGEMLADALVLKLKRLAALKQAATTLFNHAQLGQERLSRGHKEGIELSLGYTYHTTLHDILSAYGTRHAFEERKKVTFFRPPLVEISEARAILKRLLGDIVEWIPLNQLLDMMMIDDDKRKSLFVSSFAALLELAKDGGVTLMQEAPMTNLYVRAQTPAFADASHKAKQQEA